MAMLIVQCMWRAAVCVRVCVCAIDFATLYTYDSYPLNSLYFHGSILFNQNAIIVTPVENTISPKRESEYISHKTYQ